MKKAVIFNGISYTDEVALAKDLKKEYQELLVEAQKMSTHLQQTIEAFKKAEERPKLDSADTRLYSVLKYVIKFASFKMDYFQNNSFGFLNRFEKNLDVTYAAKRMQKMKNVNKRETGTDRFDFNVDLSAIDLTEIPQMYQEVYLPLLEVMERGVFLNVYESRKVIETLDSIIERVEETTLER